MQEQLISRKVFKAEHKLKGMARKLEEEESDEFEEEEEMEEEAAGDEEW